MPADEDAERPKQSLLREKRQRARRQARSKSLPSIKTRYGVAVRVRDLFEEIAKHHGRKVAQEYLRIFGAPPTKTQAKQLRDALVLDRLLAMKPKPQPYRLARELAEANKTLPKAERWGTGTKGVRAMEKYIERLVQAYDAKASAPPTGAAVIITER
jgi:hypothetical protein